MNSSPAPLTHKLIFGVLLLIFACLALLVVRLYWPGWLRSGSPGDANASTAGSPGLEESVAGDGRSATAEGRIDATRRRSVPTNQLPFSPARVAGRGNPDDATMVDLADPRPAAPPIPVTRDAEVLVVNQAVLTAPTTLAPASTPGGVVGKVLFRGTPPPEVEIDMGPMCGPLRSSPATTRHYVVGPDGGLANVVVFVYRQPSPRIEEMASEKLPGTAPSPSTPVLLDQVGCMFEPYVLAMHLNQTLTARNSDPVLHNIHLTSRINRERNIGQPMKGQVNQIRFDKPELFIRIKCDVHQWMFAYVSVFPHPYFAVTDLNGVYRIPPGLSAGRYHVMALHLKTGLSQGLDSELRLDPGRENRVDFEFLGPGLEQTSNKGRKATRP
jgi:hypothetical protein